MSISGVVPYKDFNVIRVTDDGDSVAFLAYPDFFEDPFPALAGSWRFDSASKGIKFRDYSQSLNPPILHRKELLISADHPDHSKFSTLTRTAEAIGLFDNPTRIGYRRAWIDLIRSRGYELQGYELVPIGNRQFDNDSAEPPDDFVAIERHSKLVLNIAMGKRDQATTDQFIEGVRHATAPGHFQMTTDGFATVWIRSSGAPT